MPEVVLRFPEGRYEGEVDEKKVPNGQGCLEFPGNDDMERQIYEGDFKDKMAHGKGLMRWRNGDKYEGEFLNGLRHGKGTYFSKVRPRKSHPKRSEINPTENQTLKNLKKSDHKKIQKITLKISKNHKQKAQKIRPKKFQKIRHKKIRKSHPKTQENRTFAFINLKN